MQRAMASGKKLVVKVGTKIRDTGKRTLKTGKSLLVAFLRDPRIVATWYVDIKDALVHFVKWVVTGFRLFGADVRASYYLTKRVVQGYPMTVRERRLLVRTTSDCLKLIPFSLFIIIPFAELALPFFLRLFPNMLPSTFFEQKYDNATLARKFKAKEEMAGFWQQVIMQRTKEIAESADDKLADKAAELQEFQDKLAEGQEYPSLKEILRFGRLFKENLSLKNMSPQQLSAMSRMLGLPQAATWWPGHLEVQLRHHITSLRREDREYLWEGIEGLTKPELIEACKKRAIRFHEATEDEMRHDLNRWIQLSSNREIPTGLLLWIQSFYMRPPEEVPEVSDCDELRMKVDNTEVIPEPDEKDAFHNMAERQKAQLEHAQHRLDALHAEIDEVLSQIGSHEQLWIEKAKSGHPLGKPAKTAEDLKHEDEMLEKVLCSDDVVNDDREEELEEKRQNLAHIKKLDKTLSLYRDVVDRQKVLLDGQLKFLASMRDHKPCKNKDADVILLDQRVRVMEMVQKFQQSTEEIEELLTEAMPAGEDDDEIDEKKSAAADAAIRRAVQAAASQAGKSVSSPSTVLPL